VASETWSLAWKDLRHDRRTSWVFVLTVASIVAPLLLLFGLKNGVIDTLRGTLVRDPRNLEVVIYGSARLARDWLEELAGHPSVAFLVPKTRTINASVDLVDGSRRVLPTVEVVPSADGDPLLPAGSPIPRHPDEVLITETIAEQIEAGTGVPLYAIVKRTRDGEPQQIRIPLKVIGVVPENYFARDALFTSLDLLVAAEDYRDGVLSGLTDGAIPEGYAARRTRFASARLYANGLDQVASLAEDLRARGIEVRTQAERIATVQAFDRTLSFVFRVIATIGGMGCALALGGALWVNVDRKRRQLALLRLFGFGHGAVAAVPVIQGLVIAALGFLLALAAYLVGSRVFDAVMGRNLPAGGYVSRLDSMDLATAAGLMLLVALIASMAGALRAGRLSPAEGLRETTH
jgi:putative ABC transport system permease protein